MVVGYRKRYANKLDIYPKTLKDMMDVMRQVVLKKKKPPKINDRNTSRDGDENTEMKPVMRPKPPTIRTRMAQRAIAVAIRRVGFTDVIKRVR